MFNGNWCKFIFLSTSLTYMTLLFIIYIFKSYIPPSAQHAMRYGKLVIKQKPQLMHLPKSCFRHFYIIAAFVYSPVALYLVSTVYLLNEEVPQWFKTFLNVCCGSNRIATVSATHTFIAVLLLTLQIWRRFYDTHFVSVFSKKALINILHYIPGLVYYMGAFLIILAEAPKFANKSEQNIFKSRDITWIDAIAIVVFIWAWYRQHVTTKILARLRKNKKGTVVSESYQIPYGDLFEYLSSPHCTTEILMYTSIWFIVGLQHSWWCVYLVVLVNQLDSIISTHKWYQSQFKDFPKKRKALIPFMF